MRLTLCLEGNTEGRVLASIDMEEIMKHCKANINLSDTIRDIHDNVANEMYCKGIDDFSILMKRTLKCYWSKTKINDRIYSILFDECDRIAEELKEMEM